MKMSHCALVIAFISPSAFFLTICPRDNKPIDETSRSVQFLDSSSTQLLGDGQEHVDVTADEVDNDADEHEDTVVPCMPNQEQYPAHYAAATGDREQIEHLITHHYDFTGLDDQHMTPMHYAALTNQADIIRRLYEINHDLISSSGGALQTSPLAYATRAEAFEAVDTLLELGADPYERIIDIEYSERGPFHSILGLASPYAGHQMAEIFVNHGYQFYEDDDTLHVATLFLNVDLVRYLIRQHANARHDVRLGLLPIHYVVQPALDHLEIDAEEQFERQTQLVEIFASTLFGTTTDGRTVMHLVAETGDVRLAEYLINYSETIRGTVSSSTNSSTPLPLISIVDNDGNTPLHAAAINNHDAMINFLLDEIGLEVNQKNSVGRTALHRAINRGNREAVLALMQRNASIVIPDIEGNTPLSVAQAYDAENRIESNSEESMVRLVLQEYARIHADCITNFVVWASVKSYAHLIWGILLYIYSHAQRHASKA